MKKIICALFLLLTFFLHAQNHDEWEKSKYVWGAGMAHACDIGPQGSPREFFRLVNHFDPAMYSNIQSGDIVWVSPKFLKRFVVDILPFITNPFVILINDPRDGDFSFPSNCNLGQHLQELLENPYVIHVFAQNCDYQGNSEKVSHFPIGIDFHSVAYKGEGRWGVSGSPKEQCRLLDHILARAKPTPQRKRKAFVDFQHYDSMRLYFKRYLQFGEDRTTIFNKLLPTGLIDHDKQMNRNELWRRKAEYAFSISPPGNGLDCHRTWEDLALGCIVIVKTSPLDPMYEGLPVVIVKDWSEITRENMSLWLTTYGDVLHNTEYRKKLTFDYWYEKILLKALPYRR